MAIRPGEVSKDLKGDVNQKSQVDEKNRQDGLRAKKLGDDSSTGVNPYNYVIDETRNFQDRRATAGFTTDTFSILETSIPQYARALTTWPDCYWDFTISDAWHMQIGKFSEETWEKGGVFYAPYANIQSITLDKIFSQSSLGSNSTGIKKLLGFVETTDDKGNVSVTVTPKEKFLEKEYWTPVGTLAEQAFRGQLKAASTNGTLKVNPASLSEQIPSFLEALQSICEALMSTERNRCLVTYIQFPSTIFNRTSSYGDSEVIAWFWRPDSEYTAWAKFVTVWYVSNPMEITGEELRFRTKEIAMPFIQIDLDEHAMGFRYPKQARPEGTVSAKFLESHDWIVHDFLVYWKSLLFESGSRTFGNVMNAGMYGLLRIYIPYWDKNVTNADGSKGATKYFIKRIYYWNLMCVDISEISLGYEEGEALSIETELSVEWITSSNTREAMKTLRLDRQGFVIPDSSIIANIQVLSEQIADAKAAYISSIDQGTVWQQQGSLGDSGITNPQSDSVLQKNSLGTDPDL